ncbi:MAG: DUF2059 domain-containing protein [Pseudomonadota bacterium]
MKKLLAIILCAAALNASAQTPAPETDPRATEAVKQLLASIKFRELMDKSMEQVMKNMPAMILQMSTQGINGNTKLSADEKKAMLDKAAQAIPKTLEGLRAILTDPTLIDEMEAEIVPLYARNFTLDEIRQLAEFYQSPLGSKMLSSMPAIMNESMQISQKIMMPRLSKYLEKFNTK